MYNSIDVFLSFWYKVYRGEHMDNGSVYCLTGLSEEGASFTRMDFSGTFEDFKKKNPSPKISLDASPRREGHTYIFVRGQMHPPYGIFVPDGVPHDVVLKQVKSRWGLSSEVRG
jgi:hypothetical protein